MRVRRVWFAALAVALATAILMVSTASGQTVTVAPANPEVESCYPFGEGGTEDVPWYPYSAFFYKNVPGFDLFPGDILAFDLGATNSLSPSADIELEIALARTTVNGGTVQAEPFQTVVTNTQTPENPRGDTTVGNFELRFDTEDRFDFPGGGLIIRFSNPSASYLVDDSCDQVLVNAESSDPSGFFVQAAFTDPDGVSPWTGMTGTDLIGGFQIVSTGPPETTITKGPKKKTEKQKAKLKFKADEPSTFECKFDTRRFRPCDSRKKYRGLDPGKHKFKVRATDEAGNTDPTPAKRKWKVLG